MILLTEPPNSDLPMVPGKVGLDRSLGPAGWLLLACKRRRAELSIPSLFLPRLLIRQVTPLPLGQREAKSVDYTDEFPPCGKKHQEWERSIFMFLRRSKNCTALNVLNDIIYEY